MLGRWQLTSVVCSIVLTIITISCDSLPYKAKTAPYWSEVDSMIHESWSAFISIHPSLPYPFSDALEGGILYYWDLYFIQKGLICHNQWEIAQNNLENQIFQIEKYGFIPNATASWGMDRSQHPFFSMLVYDYYFQQEAEKRDKQWLQKAYRAVVQEYLFWTDTSRFAIENHSTPIEGLQRYFHHAHDSVLIGVFDALGDIRFKEYPAPRTDQEKMEFGANAIAECTGYDFTPRFQRKIIDYIPVELNVNLWRYEMNFIEFERALGISSDIDWRERADRRKALINQYCWDEERALFLDYNFEKKEFNPIASYATFYPMLWGMATKEQAQRIVKNLPLLETDHGIRFCEPVESEISYQWDDESIWPPVQFVTYRALHLYGYTQQARRIACKYLDLITQNYLSPNPKSFRDTNGKMVEREKGDLYEKYSINGSILDGVDYPSGKMIGWCGGVFADALRYVEPPKRKE